MSSPARLRRRCVMQQSRPGSRGGGRARRRRAGVGLALAILTGIGAVPVGGADADAEGQHLLISEGMTGGAGASDEFIEIFNPGPAPLPLEGLELVYLSATGTVPSARAAWPSGAAVIPPGGHVLSANAGGSFAPIADALYGAGIAATGGSVALRIQGASSAVDAVGWGTAANPWMEGRAAPAPNAGSSMERLPGGELGSTQDSGDNLADFAERMPPDPQNTTSPPTPSTSPSPVGSPSPTIAPTPTQDAPTPTATPAVTPSETVSASASPVVSHSPSPTPSS